MGCDIHLVLERRAVVNGEEKWVGVNAFEHISDMVRCGAAVERTYHGWNVRARNYDVFAMLANVRGHTADEHEPRGAPYDMSDLARACITDWDSDGHSHSWLTAREYVSRWCMAVHGTAEMVADRLTESDAPKLSEAAAKLFGLVFYDEGDEDRRGADDVDKHRVVFWFDN